MILITKTLVIFPTLHIPSLMLTSRSCAWCSRHWI